MQCYICECCVRLAVKPSLLAFCAAHEVEPHSRQTARSVDGGGTHLQI